MNKLNIEFVKPPTSHWLSFQILYRDLEECIRYVHPAEENYKVYSLRFYELLLRAATEFESLCKEKVIELKLVEKSVTKYGIKDYFLLNAHYEHKLAKVQVGFLFPEVTFIQPLASWKKTHTLDWYQAYNDVKHNRNTKFAQANLGNVLHGIGSIFILLDAFQLCPDGKFSYLKKESKPQRIKSNKEWPVVLYKEYWSEEKENADVPVGATKME
jgi:hypothetical protein